MATNLQGMDVAEVQYVGRQLQIEASNIGSLISRVRSQMAIAEQNWQGTDASHFTSDWTAREKQLQALQTSLSTFGARALNEADQQIRASNSSSAW